eukprot:gene482-871_t
MGPTVASCGRDENPDEFFSVIVSGITDIACDIPEAPARMLSMPMLACVQKLPPEEILLAAAAKANNLMDSVQRSSPQSTSSQLRAKAWETRARALCCLAELVEANRACTPQDLPCSPDKAPLKRSATKTREMYEDDSPMWDLWTAYCQLYQQEVACWKRFHEEQLIAYQRLLDQIACVDEEQGAALPGSPDKTPNEAPGKRPTCDASGGFRLRGADSTRQSSEHAEMASKGRVQRGAPGADPSAFVEEARAPRENNGPGGAMTDPGRSGSLQGAGAGGAHGTMRRSSARRTGESYTKAATAKPVTAGRSASLAAAAQPWEGASSAPNSDELSDADMSKSNSTPIVSAPGFMSGLASPAADKDEVCRKLDFSSEQVTLVTSSEEGGGVVEHSPTSSVASVRSLAKTAAADAPHKSFGNPPSLTNPAPAFEFGSGEWPSTAVTTRNLSVAAGSTAPTGADAKLPAVSYSLVVNEVPELPPTDTMCSKCQLATRSEDDPAPELAPGGSASGKHHRDEAAESDTGGEDLAQPQEQADRAAHKLLAPVSEDVVEADENAPEGSARSMTNARESNGVVESENDNAVVDVEIIRNLGHLPVLANPSASEEDNMLVEPCNYGHLAAEQDDEEREPRWADDEDEEYEEYGDWEESPETPFSDSVEGVHIDGVTLYQSAYTLHRGTCGVPAVYTHSRHVWLLRVNMDVRDVFQTFTAQVEEERKAELAAGSWECPVCREANPTALNDCRKCDYAYTPDGTKIFVGNLSDAVTEADLEEVFQRYSPKVEVNRMSRQSGFRYNFQGYAFVRLASAQAATDAIHALHHSTDALRNNQGKELSLKGSSEDCADLTEREIVERVVLREELRMEGKFARADSIRRELAAYGVDVSNGPVGTDAWWCLRDDPERWGDVKRNAQGNYAADPPPDSASSPPAPPDWICSHCNSANLGTRRLDCQRCQAIRPESGGWKCSTCEAANWHRRLYDCARCGARRPDCDSWNCNTCGATNPKTRRQTCRKCNTVRPGSRAWRCLGCDVLNSADTRLYNCFRCGEKRPEGGQVLSGRETMGDATAEDELGASSGGSSAPLPSSVQSEEDGKGHLQGDTSDDGYHTPPAEDGKTKVFVANLPRWWREADVASMFADFSPQDINVDVRGKSPFAFVQLPSRDEARRAIREINYSEVDGHTVRLELARLPKQHPRLGGWQCPGCNRSNPAALRVHCGRCGEIRPGSGAWKCDTCGAPNAVRHRNCFQCHQKCPGIRDPAGATIGAESSQEERSGEDYWADDSNGPSPPEDGTTRYNGEGDEGACRKEGDMEGRLTVFLYNLPRHYVEEDVFALFEPFQPQHVHIDRRKPFAFVKCASHDAASDAVLALNKEVVDNYVLSACFAHKELVWPGERYSPQRFTSPREKWSSLDEQEDSDTGELSDGHQPAAEHDEISPGPLSLEHEGVIKPQSHLAEAAPPQQFRCLQELRVLRGVTSQRMHGRTMCNSLMKGTVEGLEGHPPNLQVNILQGLHLYHELLSPIEQDGMVQLLRELQLLGEQHKLLGVTYDTSCRSARKKDPSSLHFGCFHSHKKPERGRQAEPVQEQVEAMPTDLRALAERLSVWEIMPHLPDSAVVHFYEKGDFTPPHLNHHDFKRPIVCISLLPGAEMVFGGKISALDEAADTAGGYDGPFRLPLPAGSCLVLNGNAANLAQHCVPAVNSPAILVTFRNMKPHIREKVHKANT